MANRYFVEIFTNFENIMWKKKKKDCINFDETFE